MKIRIAEGRLTVVGRGFRGARLVLTSDVDRLAEIESLGNIGRSGRQVIVIDGPLGELRLQREALELGRLSVERADNLIDALSISPNNRRPIIVFSARIDKQSQTLLWQHAADIDLIAVGLDRDLWFDASRAGAVIVSQHSLHDLVRTAWMMVEDRLRARRLKLKL